MYKTEKIGELFIRYKAGLDTTGDYGWIRASDIAAILETDSGGSVIVLKDTGPGREFLLSPESPDALVKRIAGIES